MIDVGKVKNNQAMLAPPSNQKASAAVLGLARMHMQDHVDIDYLYR